MSTSESAFPRNGAGNTPMVGVRYFDRESGKIVVIEFGVVDLEKFNAIFCNCNEDEYIERILILPSREIGIDHVQITNLDPPTRFIPISRTADPIIDKKFRVLHDDNDQHALYDSMVDVIAAIKTQQVVVSRKCPVCGYEFSGYPPYVNALDRLVVITCPGCQTIMTPVA